jgi:hypothetical protein
VTIADPVDLTSTAGAVSVTSDTSELAPAYQLQQANGDETNMLGIGGQTCSGGMAGFQCLDNGNLLDPVTGIQYCGPGSGTAGNICVPLPSGGTAPSSSGACSFSPDTPVLMKDGKTKPIGEIEPGDEVEAADPASGKHAGPHTVTATWVNHDTDLVDVTVRGLDGKPRVLHTTANHPFWDDTSHTWTPADALHPGDQLNTDRDRHVTVLSTRVTPGAANRDNLTVAELHTYYVLAGDTPVLVHNSNCGIRPHDKARGAAGVDEMTETFEKFYDKSDIYSESYGNGLDLWTPYGRRQVDIAVRNPGSRPLEWCIDGHSAILF